MAAGGMKTTVLASLCLTALILLSQIDGGETATCKYWDGRAPFCNGSCPSNCKTVTSSKRGNGATCWSGRKRLCDCCIEQDLCTPTQTSAKCYGVVLVCRNEQLTIDFTGRTRTKTCSAYVCGGCIGFPFRRRARHLEYSSSDDEEEEDTTCGDNISARINPFGEDIVEDVGVDLLTEEDVEALIVATYGTPLTDAEEANTVRVGLTEPIVPPGGADDCGDCTCES